MATIRFRSYPFHVLVMQLYNMMGMSFIPKYWKLNKCLVCGQFRDKLRKVGSSQIWFRGRLDPFLDYNCSLYSQYVIDNLHTSYNYVVSISPQMTSKFPAPPNCFIGCLLFSQCKQSQWYFTTTTKGFSMFKFFNKTQEK